MTPETFDTKQELRIMVGHCPRVSTICLLDIITCDQMFTVN